MNKDLENILKKIENLIKIGKDGKAHQSLITKDEARALKSYIDSLRIQLSATEKVAIGWQKKYNELLGEKNKEDIEFLFDLK